MTLLLCQFLYSANEKIESFWKVYGGKSVWGKIIVFSAGNNTKNSTESIWMGGLA